jgi:exopolyphosphatase/guanosine-5'-triphosphate,3'-diphosphate pyrophosphatase
VGEVLAALDCGTNSTRLLVVDEDGRVLTRRMTVTRLGQGVDRTRRLAPEAIERTVAVLRQYAAEMARLGVTRARLAATSAARDAENAATFLAAAAEATGVDPEILSGEEEARLSFQGATAQLPPDLAAAGPVLVVDIGGGSTELAVGRPEEPDAVRAVSVDLGCVRLTERFLAEDPPSAAALGAARAEVRAVLSTAHEVLPTPAPGGTLVGLAGTVSTLVMLARGVGHYRRELVHHQRISRQEVESWLARLAGEPVAARRREPGMVEGRADVIVGGALVLAEALAVFDQAACLASEEDILDGLVASLRRSSARPPGP